MGRVLPSLDATTNIGVPISRGVDWIVGLITPSELDPSTITAIVAASETVFGTPSPLRGGWFSGRTSAVSTQPLTGLTGVFLVSPFELRCTETIIDIGLGVTGSGSGKIRLGITDTNSTGTPVNFLGGGSGVGDAGAHDFGTIDPSTTGEKNVGTSQFGTPLSLTPGRYHVVGRLEGPGSGEPTIRSYTSDEYGISGGTGAPPAGPIAGFQGTVTGGSGAFGSTLGGISATTLSFGPRILLRAQ